MKKRVISSVLVLLIAVSFVLPALATGSVGNEGLPAAASSRANAGNNAGIGTDPEVKAEPKSFMLLNGVSQSAEYELRSGTTYVTVSSFAAMADPQAVVKEENGVVTVSSSQGEEALSMTASAKTPYVIANGRCLYAKDSVTTVNGRIALPIRVLAQVFNLNVSYDAAANQILLTHIQGSGAYIQPGDSYYDADSLYWLSHIINAESGNQSLEGKIAVGNVVMNRVNSPEFPNTIYDVLHQKNQFSPVARGTIKRTPNDESVVAAKLVMEGVQVVPTALFFHMKGLNCYASKYRSYVTTIGAHAFYA